MLRQFFDYYRPHMGLFWLDFGCAVLSGLLELAFPLAVAGFIDHLLPQGDWGLTVLASAGLVGVYIVNALLMVVVIYWGHMLGINIETEMRARYAAHVASITDAAPQLVLCFEYDQAQAEGPPFAIDEDETEAADLLRELGAAQGSELYVGTGVCYGGLTGQAVVAAQK